MVRKPQSQPSVLDLFEQTVQELDDSVHSTNILSYKPYPEQLRFHKSQAFGRYISGGNRGGKTNSQVVDAIWTATNTHPYRKWPKSWGKGLIQLRFVVVDIDQGVNEFILPVLRRWTAKSMLVDGRWESSWNQGNLTFTFSNGSTIDFLTFGMALEKHGGVPRHAVYFDEIPPQAVFNENSMRLIDYEGFWVIAATSTEGMGWTYDFIWEPVEEGDITSEEIELFTMTQEDNIYLAGTTESRNRYYIGMDETEERIRRKGEMTARSGLIFPYFKNNIHVVPEFVPSKKWMWYSSADFGFNNPTAWLWHAVSPSGDIVTFAEHYKSEMHVAAHVNKIHEIENELGKEADIRLGDPAGNQRQMNTGTSAIKEYAVRGIYISTEMIPHDVEIGLEKMHQYFETLEEGSGWGPNRPRWVITENCVNFIRELRKLRYATYESTSRAYNHNKMEVVHKKDDHAFDSARYFATLMPDLSDNAPVVVPKQSQTVDYVEVMLRSQGIENADSISDDSYKTIWDFDYRGY